MTAFDPVRFKEAQANTWSAAAAGWRTWWKRVEPLLEPVSERLLALAKIAPGMRVLDVGTGIGEPALAAAGVVGPTGHVVATDIAPGMIEIARERAASAGISNITFEAADVEALDHPAASFDAIISRHTLMFVPNLPEALVRLRRLLRPGGMFAASAIGAPQENAWLVIPMIAAREVLDLPPADPAAPTPFSLSDPEALRRSLEEAGFADITLGKMAVSAELDSPEEFLRFQLDVNGVLRSLLAAAPTDRSERVKELILERLRPFALPDGHIALAASANIASAPVG